MWTGLKENNVYSAQVSVFRGAVKAEIILKDKEEAKEFGFFSVEMNLWLTVADKSFKPKWGREVSEREWKLATEWVEQQFELINKYSTVLVTKPNYIKTI